MRAVGANLALLCAAACKETPASEDAAVATTRIEHVEQALARIVATCAEARGTVETRRKGQPQWDPAKVGATFRERDWVRTGPGGFARIRFSGGGFLELREGTTILVDTALSIESGSLVAITEPGANPIVVRSKDGSEARIVAAAGDAGAHLRLTASGPGLEIAVTKGSVNVVTGDGEQSIAAGEARDLAGRKISAPIKLIGFPRSLAPGVDARFLFAVDLKVAIAWKAVPQAARYRVQVSRDTQFESLVLDADAATTGVAFAPDAIGVYAWRVAAIDGSGRLGEFGFARRIYLEEEEPRDLLVSPPHGIKFGFAEKYPRIGFSWQSAGNTKNYKLVIRDGETTVATLATTNQRIEVSTLREGTYEWGVYAVRDNREVPIFLSPRMLTIRKQRVKAHTEKLWDDRR